MAAMPRHSPGGHHILLWIAAAIGLLLLLVAAVAVFRGFISQASQ
jgi:hypothetical protein